MAAVASPYAPFQAEEWRLPKVEPAPCPQQGQQTRVWSCWVQGELFTGATTAMKRS
jgi:hypothetical protein